MDDSARSSEPVSFSWREWRRDLLCLTILLLLCLGLRLWVVAHTAVPARDSIGFIRYALQLENLPYRIVLLNNHQHPGYPAALLLTSWPLRDWYGGITCANMQFAAQLTSALAGWLLIVPMFYLGKLFFDRQVAFWGTLLFQCLPDSGHGLSDAISDPLYLLCLITALLFAARALNQRSVGQLVFAGLSAGLGYLVRPEAALLLPATLAILLLLQRLPAWRTTWSRCALRGLALVLPAVLVGSPYWMVTGAFTRKPTADQMIGINRDAEPERVQAPRSVQGPLLAVHIDLEGSLTQRLGRAVYGLAGEVIHAFQYMAWLPALLGVFWYQQRWRQAPGAWLIGLFLLGMTLLLVWLAASVGYVSNRHLMLQVLCLTFPAVACVRDLPGALLAYLRQQNEASENSGVSRWLQASFWSVVLLLSLTGAGLAKTLQPLHSHRAGFYAAGRWLAEHVAPWDWIADDHAWAHYYSGHVFREGQRCTPPSGVRPVNWIVYSRASERRAPSHRRAFSEKDVRAKGGELVFYWPEQEPEEKARVLVFRMPPGARILQ